MTELIKLGDLPSNETGAANDDDDIVTYLVVTNNPKGELTVYDVDKVYDVIIWNNPVGYYNIVVEYESLNDDYIDRCNIMNLNKNEMFP